jgi:beta-lactamase regulating signal transducer with metallopeptidase domain
MNMPLWFSNLTFWSAQVLLLVLAAGILPGLLRICQPRVLLGYWRTLLAISLLLPFVQSWHRLEAIGAITIAPDPGSVSATRSTELAVKHWHLPSLTIVAQVAGLVILAGIAARFLIFALGLLKLRQLRRASSPISRFPESAALLEEMVAVVGARVEFRVSADVDSPVTFGFAAPVILLPERFPLMAARFQSAVACHELLHVRRMDWAHHLSEEIIRTIFWFQPAIAWLIGRVRLAREQVVDLEVVRITQARTPYLEALMEFANSRASGAAVPAPPFLAERQLVERVSLMLKEVRMSRTRLIASLIAMACCLALAITLAARTFPLKAAPKTGVDQGVSSGTSGGVAGGPSGGVNRGGQGGFGGGVSDGVSGSPAGDIPTVGRDTIWTDTVKRGAMVRQVLGLGKLVRSEDSGNLLVRVTLPEAMLKEVQLNQNVTVNTRKDAAYTQKDLVKGHVKSLSREISNGSGTVEVGLDAALPQGVAAGLDVDATIDVEKLDNILHVGRPVHAAANSAVSLFKIVSDGTEAVRVNVKMGRSSVSTIEVLDGLKEGDQVILSDMSEWDSFDRIHLK